MSAATHALEDDAPSAARQEGTEETIIYNDSISRWFVGASVVFAIVALLVGVVIALQLVFHQANVGPMLSFGRLRPLHTNAAIFAFVGNMMFAGIYYSTQRLVKARLPSDLLAKVHFWGWQAIIVAAALSLPMGMTTGKEYAELEWPIDVAITVVWIVFAINFFWTLARRREKQLYVAIWFYIATIITVAVLHIVNSLELPISATKSYSIYGGAQDALVQWWYGHNAVAFFLTTPILGIMYYFLPKAADRPVYSYRLSIVHFWALVFLYIWAGPHHLLNTALPDWAQTLGMIFSLMLWAPSWGGMINGLLTLRGAWDRVRVDPVLKFFAAGVTFYGMATFEGPLLSIKSVSALSHYTDWIIGHVHGGALGWNGLMAAGMFYWMVPRLYGTKLYSTRAANLHFYLATVGIIMYMVSMWVSGVTQGLMWRATNPDGSLLYPRFIETLLAQRPMYWTRLLGGTLYLVGALMMAWNLAKTALSGKPVDGEAHVFVPAPDERQQVPWSAVIFGRPTVLAAITLTLVFLVLRTDAVGASGLLALAAIVAIGGLFAATLTKDPSKPTWHAILEGRSLLFTVLTLIAVLIGGVAELVPSLFVQTPGGEGQRPYRALALEGRDIYLREGCYLCHSQMIRPFVWEQKRYGEPSRLEDSRYDHPFQWGSKRTGPDLARIGGQYPSSWHWRHMIDAREISPGSNMPSYAFMATRSLDLSHTADKLRAMRALGVPYTPEQLGDAVDDAHAHAAELKRELLEANIEVQGEPELLAVIAYLQSLGVPPRTLETGGAPISLRPQSGTPTSTPQ